MSPLVSHLLPRVCRCPTHSTGATGGTGGSFLGSFFVPDLLADGSGCSDRSRRSVHLPEAGRGWSPVAVEIPLAGDDDDPAVPLGRLVVVRHGATAWSVSGQHTSFTDLPLLPEGEVQARSVGRLLAQWPFAAVLTSPLARARRTAELAGFGAVAEVTADLREWGYGEHEGRTTAEIRDLRPGWTIWRDGPEGGERVSEVGRRADRIVERARQVDGDTLCFAHGHVLRVLAARWVGLPAAAGSLFQLDAGALGVLGWERRTPVLVEWNRSADGTLRRD